MSVEPRFGGRENEVIPTLKVVWRSLRNCLITRFAAPSLLPGESASPSNVLKFAPVNDSVCVIVCELPKTMNRFGFAPPPPPFRRSLSSPKAGIAANEIARAKARRRRWWVPGIVCPLLWNGEELGIDADVGVYRLARLDGR